MSDPRITHKVISSFTSRLISSNIDPFLLARLLFSNNIISEECYRTVTDRHCGMTATQRLEYLIHTIRGHVKTKPTLFDHFLTVLTALDSLVACALAEEMRTAYNVQEIVYLQDDIQLGGHHMIQPLVDDTIEKIYKWQESRRHTVDKLSDLTVTNYWRISFVAFSLVIGLILFQTLFMSTLLPLILVCVISTIVRTAAGFLAGRVNFIEAQGYVDNEKGYKRDVIKCLQKVHEMDQAGFEMGINSQELLHIFTTVIHPHDNSDHSSLSSIIISAVHVLTEALPCGMDPVARLNKELSHELNIVSITLKKNR